MFFGGLFCVLYKGADRLPVIRGKIFFCVIGSGSYQKKICLPEMMLLPERCFFSGLLIEDNFYDGSY